MHNSTKLAVFLITFQLKMKNDKTFRLKKYNIFQNNITQIERNFYLLCVAVLCFSFFNVHN